jgi:hypothetical protein
MPKQAEASKSKDRAFNDPIPFPRDGELVTSPDVGNFIAKLSTREHVGRTIDLDYVDGE